MKRIEGSTDGEGLRVCVIDTSWNAFVVDALTKGALGALRRAGVADEDVTHVTVAGAFELPVVCQAAARSGRYDAIVALGAVIRGATPHFDYVAGEAAKGCARVALDGGLPVAFGVLTVDTIEQAIERSGTKAGNKGAEAAVVAIETARTLAALGEA